MAAIPSCIEITDNTVACFIERSSRIMSINKLLISQWLNMICSQQHGKRSYKNYINMEVISATENEDQVWNAIERADHIWCQTNFNGDSADLFTTMLENATEAGLQDKYFFDLADRNGAMKHLLETHQTADMLMKTLEDRHNIRFFFWEDIANMMGLSPS